MKCLFAPWRSKYTKNTGESKQEKTTQNQCVFCQKLETKQDEKNFIIRRFEYNAILLNLYPYNAGHLLIMPLSHVANLHDMTKPAREEMMELTTHSNQIIQKIFKNDGANIGLNLGKAAGAGIPSHLHMHVLPRWLGDTNFLPIFGETKQISFDLTDIYKKLKPEFDLI